MIINIISGDYDKLLTVLYFKLICRIVPMVYIMPLLGYIVKNASSLSAVAELELNVMG